MAGYAQSLSTVLKTAAIPYGLTLTTWGSGAAIQHHNGAPTVWEVFLFATGGLAGYVLLAALAGRTLRETGPARPDAVAAGTGVLDVIAVGAAIGTAALLGQIGGWGAWPLGGFGGIGAYLLLAAVQHRAVSASAR